MRFLIKLPENMSVSQLLYHIDMLPVSAGYYERVKRRCDQVYTCVYMGVYDSMYMSYCCVVVVYILTNCIPLYTPIPLLFLSLSHPSLYVYRRYCAVKPDIRSASYSSSYTTSCYTSGPPSLARYPPLFNHPAYLQLTHPPHLEIQILLPLLLVLYIQVVVVIVITAVLYEPPLALLIHHLDHS